MEKYDYLSVLSTLLIFFNHVNPYFAFAFAYSLKELTGAFMVLSVFPEDNLKCVYVDAGS